MKRIAVLISNKGKGTNLQAIINAVESGIIHAKIIVVVSDTQDAYGVKRAAKHQLTVEICQKKEYLLSILKKYDPAYIALAGWKQIILVAGYQAVTQNDITSIAPTQLFLVAGVLGILGLYLKDEK